MVSLTTASSTAAGGEAVITVMAWYLNESIYGWMLALTAVQDLAFTAFIFSLCRR